MEKNSLNNPEIERIIHLLEYEISSRHSEAKRQGWTTWAILGAVASLLWLMLSVLDTAASISWRNILFIVLLSSISCDFFLPLKTLFFGESYQSLNGNRFEYIDISRGRFGFFLLLRTILLLILVSWFSPVLSQLVKLSCWGFFVLSLIIIIGSVILFFLKIPVPIKADSRYKWSVYIYSIIWAAAGCIAIVGLVRIIYFHTIAPSISEWRIGLIVFSLSLLILFLFHFKPNPTLLLQLDDIRQRLSLGQIKQDIAKQQIDLIIHGLTLSTILQSKINEIFVILKTMQNTTNKFHSELAIIDKFVKTSSEKLDDDNFSTASEALKALSEMQKELASQNQMVRNKYLKLDRKIMFFYGMTKDKIFDIGNILKSINAEVDKVDKLYNTALVRLDDLHGKLNKKVEKIVQQPHSQELS